MSEPNVIPSDVAMIAPHEVDTLNLSDQPTLLTVRSFGLTDPGRVRESNQDQFLIAVLRKALGVQQTSLPGPKVRYSGDQSYLFVVADGIGGVAGGEQASALAIDSVEAFVLDTFQWFAQFKGNGEDKLLADFQSALGQAHARLLAEGTEHPELHGMGTTLTLAYSLNDMLFVAHAGDSRCYLCRQDVLYRVTSDHSLVEDMKRQGGPQLDDATKRRLRHVITNAVGGDSADVKVEVHKLHLEAGDAVLLCTDGLTNMVPDEEIAHILQSQADPEQACKQLVAQANEQGGKDNITVIVARFEAATGY